MAIKKGYELTQEGVENLKKELQYLKEVRRAEIVEALKEARAQGDLSENADYDAARNEQALIEERIKQIENILKDVRIIRSTAEDVVGIGKRVRFLILDSKVEREILLVGTIEADPKVNKISIESPVGRALMNQKKNDIVTVQTDAGKVYDIQILDFE
ncbi:MAG TPA: transcription elongation factor GreA [Acholeplasma sp.]|jgi:transcription elongation factor GreA|nr:transcription elongation factor GreA [Acholeplasma sp.]